MGGAGCAAGHAAYPPLSLHWPGLSCVRRMQPAARPKGRGGGQGQCWAGLRACWRLPLEAPAVCGSVDSRHTYMRTAGALVTPQFSSSRAGQVTWAQRRGGQRRRGRRTPSGQAGILRRLGGTTRQSGCGGCAPIGWPVAVITSVAIVCHRAGPHRIHLQHAGAWRGRDGVHMIGTHGRGASAQVGGP